MEYIWVMPAAGLIVARKGCLSELIQFRDPICIRNWAFSIADMWFGFDFCYLSGLPKQIIEQTYTIFLG